MIGSTSVGVRDDLPLSEDGSAGFQVAVRKGGNVTASELLNGHGGCDETSADAVVTWMWV
jgi:hypothetical protein